MLDVGAGVIRLAVAALATAAADFAMPPHGFAYFVSSVLLASLLNSKYRHNGSRLGNRLCGVDSYGCGYSCSVDEEPCLMPAVCLGLYFPQSAR